MQQEDDLRALAKIMDFLRAVSIILVVMNVYWYCYASIVEWHLNIGVVDRIMMNCFIPRSTQNYSLFFSWPCRAWERKA